MTEGCRSADAPRASLKRMSDEPPGQELLFIAARVQSVGELYARIMAKFELGALIDGPTLRAWLMTAWADARVVIAFLTNRSSGGKYKNQRVAMFMAGWKPPDKQLRRRLEDHHETATHHVAHLFEQTDVSGGFSYQMPYDIVDAVDSLVAEMDERGDDLADQAASLRSAAIRARACLDNPIQWAQLADIVSLESLAEQLGLDRSAGSHPELRRALELRSIPRSS